MGTDFFFNYEYNGANEPLYCVRERACLVTTITKENNVENCCGFKLTISKFLSYRDYPFFTPGKC